MLERVEHAAHREGGVGLIATAVHPDRILEPRLPPVPQQLACFLLELFGADRADERPGLGSGKRDPGLAQHEALEGVLDALVIEAIFAAHADRRIRCAREIEILEHVQRQERALELGGPGRPCRL